MDLIHKDAIQKLYKEFFSSLRIAYSNSHDHAIIQHVLLLVQFVLSRISKYTSSVASAIACAIRDQPKKRGHENITNR